MRLKAQSGFDTSPFNHSGKPSYGKWRAAF
jgi:hypothetical protein